MRFLQLVGPLPKMIGLALAGVENDRASSVDEKSAEVAVAPFGDSTHVSLEPARVLPVLVPKILTTSIPEILATPA